MWTAVPSIDLGLDAPAAVLGVFAKFWGVEAPKTPRSISRGLGPNIQSGEGELLIPQYGQCKWTAVVQPRDAVGAFWLAHQPLYHYELLRQTDRLRWCRRRRHRRKYCSSTGVPPSTLTDRRRLSATYRAEAADLFDVIGEMSAPLLQTDRNSSLFICQRNDQNSATVRLAMLRY